MRNKKLLIRVTAIVLLVAFMVTGVCIAVPELFAKASTVTDAQRRQREAQRKKETAEKSRDEEIARREKLDIQISQIQSEIDKYQLEIDEKNKQIEETQKQIDELSAALIKQNEDYMARAELLIQKGNISYLEIIFNSKSIDDMMSRLSMVKMIADYDSNRLNEIKKSMEEVELLKEELLKQKEEVIGLKSVQDEKKLELDGYREESQAIIDKLQQDIALYEKEYEEAKKIEQQARNEAERLRIQAESGTGSVVAPAQFVGGQFLWPSTSSYLVTSPYGYRIHPVTGSKRFHAGIDIGAAHGTNIVAANSGTVIVAGYNAGGYGNYVVISHGGGYSTLYAHASALCVSRGQQVSKGQVIAKCGSTGMSTGPHIHYEVQYNGQTVNPMQFYR